MDLRALSDFVLVATHGGFSQASRTSGEPKATLSRRVAEFEQKLGIRLFDRDARTIRLTEEGEALLARARGPLAEIAEAEAALVAGGNRPHGRLRISAPMLLSQIALGAITAAYVKANPAVHPEIIADDRLVSAVEEGFDILIRFDPKETEGLAGRCIFRDTWVVVAHPSIVRPDWAKAGEVLPAVLWTARPGALQPPVLCDGESIEIRHEPVMLVSSLLTLYQAVLNGAGVGVLPNFLTAQAVATGRLVKLGDVTHRTSGVWALHPSRRHNSVKVTSFLDHLSATFPDGVWPKALGEGWV